MIKIFKIKVSKVELPFPPSKPNSIIFVIAIGIKHFKTYIIFIKKNMCQSEIRKFKNLWIDNSKIGWIDCWVK